MNIKGLTEEEVLASREKYGMNLLTPPKRKPIWKLYLEKFSDPVIKVLLVAAVLSLVISVIENEYAETLGIFFAIFLATGIGFWFEYDANKKFDLLNAVGEETPVTVVRDGRVHEIARKEVVVGDIVIINTGEEIPADGVLLEAVSLQVNESTLTGELMVNKTVREEDFDKEATYPSNAVMRGTTISDGHGTMRVDRVGDSTEIGKVARQATEESSEETPLNQQLTKLADFIGKAGFTIAALTFIIFTGRDLYQYLSQNDISGWQEWLVIIRIVLKYFMMAVTLIVVAVPEGLPMSVSLSLALNMRRMLKTNNLVRKMHACETMGAITVICTDKTGTLTQNQMRVHEAQLYPSNEGIIYEGIALNSTAFLEEKGMGEHPSGVGNPTEIALLLWLREHGQDYSKLRSEARIVSQLTFSTERKYMATLVDGEAGDSKEAGDHKGMGDSKGTGDHKGRPYIDDVGLGNMRRLYVKGAPEIVMSKCPISESERKRYEHLLTGYQNKAMRTLGIAYKVIDSGETDCETLVCAGGLEFLGIFAISDPIREDVPAAVQQCQDAGISIKIVTGDTPGTATEIARQIGLWKAEDSERNRITGADFAALTDEEALERVMDLKVMSRARPMDKQRLVELLQKRGAVVAVTGDGTNDAPALNHAQVGLSMGTGTSVAKEASDITLLDDSFRSIATAVMWGRSLYKNIQRFIVFQLTINVVALVSVLLGGAFGTELPLTVTQMLWVNLIMDTFAAMALATISPSMDVMKEKPRNRDAFIITKSMRNNILLTAMFFLAFLLGMLGYYNSTAEGMDVHHLTIFFTTFVMLQFWNLFNASVFGTTHSIFKDASHALGMLSVAMIILIGQIVIVTFGGKVFRTVPLSIGEWVVITAVTSVVLWVGETIRKAKR